MKKYNLKRFLASLLAVLMLASVTGVSPAVFAEDTPTPDLVETSSANPVEVLIKGTYTDDEVRSALANTLLTNADQVNAQSLDWTYKCSVKGSYALGTTLSAREATVSVFGETQTEKYSPTNMWPYYDATYTYPALKANADGAYTLYLDNEAVYINKVAKYSSSVDFTTTDISVPFNNDGTINYAQLKERIMEKVVTNPADIDRSSIVLTYEASPDLGKLSDVPGINQLGKKWKPIDGGSEKFGVLDVPYFAMDVGTNKIKLSWAGNDTYNGFEKEFTVEFKDNRIATNIVVKENASITYNVDKDAMKQDIFDKVIDWAASTPADKTALTYENFKFEYNGKDLADAKLNADEKNPQDITISYSGDANSKPCKDVSASVIVKKADVKVSMNKFSKAYAGDEEALTKEALGVALDPNDPRIDIYMVFAGINTNFDGSVNLVLTDDQWKVIENISAAEKEIYNAVGQIFPEYKDRPTLQEKLEDGITIGEFKQYISDLVTVLEKVASLPGVDNIFKRYNIDIDSIRAMVNIFEAIDFADDTTIAFGVPKHAGLYRAYAIAVNKNYEPNYATGTVLILMNWKNIKIVPNADLKKQTITVSEAKEYADGTKAAATLLNKSTGESSGIDQSALHYRFTGLNKIYSSHDFPTAPGKYIVTVSVRGGDYYALPTTFTFTVKAD